MGHLRRGNSELAKDRIWVWSIPALWTTLEDGSRFVTCPHAGVCAAPCYARHGTYRFSNVRAAHDTNLRATFDLTRWTREMVRELRDRRFRGGWVRIHDAGDFYSRAYAIAWCDIARQTPRTSFYAYTKEVSMMKDLERIGLVPSNLVVIFSLGGLEDHLVDRENDRHADVFPDLESLEADGYHDQSADDRLAAIGPHRVGIVANRIPQARRMADGRPFGQWQRSRQRDRPDRSGANLGDLGAI